MNATHRSKTHKVKLLVVSLNIVVCSLDLSVLKELVLTSSDVDLHEILINDAAGAKVEVTYLRVTHLALWKTYGLTTSLECAHRIVLAESLNVRSSLSVDDIRLILSTLAPTVEDHQKYFLVHIVFS